MRELSWRKIRWAWGQMSLRNTLRKADQNQALHLPFSRDLPQPILLPANRCRLRSRLRWTLTENRQTGNRYRAAVRYRATDGSPTARFHPRMERVARPQ
jgi:hypothetical protein